MGRAIILLCAAGALGLGVRDLEAATFSVNPVQIHLSPKTASALLTLRNDSTDTLRFQLSAFSWDQTPAEQIQLAPTTDVLFFPQLLTLGPGEARKIRIGTVTAFGASEKTYRLFVEELPPLDQPGQARSGVAVLTKLGIPVFLAAAKPLAQLEIAEPGLQQNTLSFVLRNAGNTHFMTGKILVRGFNAAGEVVIERPLTGWYVLGGRARHYRLEIPPGDCSRIASSTIEVTSGGHVVTARITATPSACTP